jgi:hypothetical protein
MDVLIRNASIQLDLLASHYQAGLCVREAEDVADLVSDRSGVAEPNAGHAIELGRERHEGLPVRSSLHVFRARDEVYGRSSPRHGQRCASGS